MIKIKNVYYMLSYAFRVLNEDQYKKLGTENFHNVADLCSGILILGVRSQVKRGLRKEYKNQEEILSGVRGKINITESIKAQTMIKKKLICEYDEFSMDCTMNRILKSVMILLMKADIEKARKKELRKLLIFFEDVQETNLDYVDWNFRYNKNNQTYTMMMSICYLVVHGLLQQEEKGKLKLMDFLKDDYMNRLYEKFILEFYKKEFPILSVTASQIKWQLDNDFSDMLPRMQSDVMLSYDNKVLIIDAKFYTNLVQSNFNSQKVHSANLYQIFTYVKNKESELKDEDFKVSGMLLYAKVQEVDSLDLVYQMSGNAIAVKTLDLNQDFAEIREQLHRIVKDYLII